MTIADQVFIAMMAVWIVAELALVAVMRANASGDSHRDRGTLPLVIVAIGGALGGAAWLTWTGIGAWPAAWVPTLRWVGAAGIAIGLAIRWTAVLTLRRYFTVTVAIRADHKLVDWGLYRYVRHPSYSGGIVALLGLGLGTGGWLAGLVILVPITLAILQRIRVEDAALAEGLGAVYRDWCARTPALVPRLWTRDLPR